MSDTPTILKKILARKAEEVAERSAKVSIDDLKAQIEAQKGGDTDPRGFVDSMARAIAEGRSAVIAEAKKASPSKGVIRENFVPAEIAQVLRSRRRELSVRTDRRGLLSKAQKSTCNRPVRRAPCR